MKIVTKKLLKIFKWLTGFYNKYLSKNIPFSIIMFICMIVNTNFVAQSFKSDQLYYDRVSGIYNERIEGIINMLEVKKIDLDQIEVFLMATKLEGELNLYAKNKSDNEFVLLRKYDFCQNSGKLGPKRKEWDGQIPEGFYYINHFNPSSSYHLSLGINYPNKSDELLSVAKNLGDNIYIHGNCVTIGCIPITDHWIEELYVLCMEARNNGQKKIPVYIFPFKFDEVVDIELDEFWINLKSIYNHVMKNKKLIDISVDRDGYYYLSNEDGM